LDLAEWQPNQLLFVDESAANERTMDRKYGWAPVGATPYVYQSIKCSERWSLLPVYTIDGFFNWEIIQGSYTTESFNAFVENKVLPYCNPYPGPRSILVIDNAKIHHNEVRIT
jgi:DDE superfamily endonuclease